MDRATVERRSREPRTASETVQRAATTREAELGEMRDGLNAAPVVRQLRAAQAKLRAPAAAGGPTVQRVVRWNGVTYNRKNIGPLGRALSRVLEKEDADPIIAHALAPGTYIYAGLRPQLIRAQEEPVVAQLPVEQLAEDNGGAEIVDDAHELEDHAPVGAHQQPEPLQGGGHPDDLPVEVEDQAILPRAPIDMTLADAPARLGRTSWADYQRLYAERTATVNALHVPQLQAGRYLYHATPRATAPHIKAGGLQPRRPEWGTASASKDGYLSMSLTLGGASTMNREAGDVLLRVALTADMLGPTKWRQASATELLTTQSFAPDVLEWSRLLEKEPRAWRPMNEYPH